MNDRLDDILSVFDLEHDREQAESPVSKSNCDIEMGQIRLKKHDDMSCFLQEVETIEKKIDEVKDATSQIKKMNEDSIQAMTTEKENAASGTLQSLVETTNGTAKCIKNRLDLLHKEAQEQNEMKKTAKDSNNRVRENMLNNLTRKFTYNMTLYQDAQQKYKADMQSKIRRQVHIVKPEATDEEVDAIMMSSGGRDALYKEQILGVNDPILTMYAEAMGKYEDVRTLEQSMQELHQMFLDFAILTVQQGELFDHVEYQIERSADYVDEGNDNVIGAIQYLKKIRKKQCLIIAVVAVCIIVATILILTM